MSTRITLRIGNTTPDDLEIQRFLRILGQKNLSRQGWIKHAMILGFAQLEKEMVSTDVPDGGQQAVNHRKAANRRTAFRENGEQGPSEHQGSSDRQGSGDRRQTEHTEHTENDVEPDHHQTWTHPVQTPSPQPVPASQPQAQPLARDHPPAGGALDGMQSPAGSSLAGGSPAGSIPAVVQPHAEVQPVPQPQAAALQAADLRMAQPLPVAARDEIPSQDASAAVIAAPNPSGSTKTIPPSAKPPSAGQPGASLPGASPPGATLAGPLTEEDMRFSPATVQQARKLMGSFGKGYDG
ncbi:MAG: hypothetical protein M0003_09310 [Acidithiobacillus sp.]|nr:hypothetical protein [Acidithiobacillus sp.]